MELAIDRYYIILTIRLSNVLFVEVDFISIKIIFQLLGLEVINLGNIMSNI